MKARNTHLSKAVALFAALLVAGGTTGISADTVLAYDSISSHSDSGADGACSGLSSGASCSWSTYNLAIYCRTISSFCCWWKPEADPNGIPNNRTDWTGTCGTGADGRLTCNDATSVQEPGVSYGTTYGAACPPSGS
jgi:hypothetical protein